MKKRLLLIEDVGRLNTQISEVSSEYGYHVLSCPTLKEAKKAIEQNPPFDLAIADYRLVDASNGEAIKFLAEKEIPTLVLTAMISDETRLKILNYKVIDYFQKDSTLTLEFIDRMLKRLNKNPTYNILIVDDSKTARLTVKRLALRHRYQVLEAASGEEALEALKRHKNIKVVISDYDMHKMNGISLTKEIRKTHPKDELAIIGISASEHRGVSAKFLKYGANDFLTKPFCEEEFYCRLNQNLDNLENIKQITISANTDFLTELSNRRHFHSKVLSLPNYTKQNICIAMLDIDHFKRINDNFGHDVGDLALLHLAQSIKTIFGDAITARFGGEEFCIASEKMKFSIFCEKLEKLRILIEQKPFTHKDNTITYTVSIGASYSSKKLEDFLIDIDTLLYKAKQSGRNRLVVK